MIEKPFDHTVSDIVTRTAKSLTLCVEQSIAVCIKPKPRFISRWLWLRLASLFIYIEKTQPRLRMEGDD